jgi:signal transduction histidine kinase
VHARIAWSLAAAAGAAALAETVLLASHQPLLSAATFDHGWPIITAAAVAGSVLGALVVSRSPRHRIGWLLCAGQFGVAVGLALQAFGARVLDDSDAASTVGHWALWLAQLVSAPYALALVATLFLLAPNGRLPSRRWRVALALCAAGVALHVAAVVVVGPAGIGVSGRSDVGPVAESLFNASIGCLAVAMIAAATSLVRRIRRARGEERQQLRWVAAPAVALAVGLLIAVLGGLVVGTDTPTPSALVVPFFLAYASLPVCAGIAVLRYRLYDIDVVINRAVLLGLATAFVAAVYVTGVVVLGATIGAPLQGFWPSLLATAAVALAFQPVRSSAVSLADRIAYGSRAAPYEALSRFSRRIGDAPSPDDLLPAVAEAVGRAVSAPARVTLEVETGPRLSARWPPGAVTDEPSVVEPVTERGQKLGAIAVQVPPGRTIRADERRLLTGLAGQTGLAFRNLALETELTARVADLDRRTGELAASRQRLIETRDRERRRLESAIRREVLPPLQRLLTRLDQLPRLDQAQSAASSHAAVLVAVAEQLDELVEEVVGALASLRALTNGVYPAALARGGLAAALHAVVATAGHDGTLEVDASMAGRRFPPQVEAAVHDCCQQAARDLGGPLVVRIAHEHGALELEVVGETGGTVDTEHLVDRVEAIGGSVSLAERGGSTSLHVTVPVSSRVPDGVPA